MRSVIAMAIGERIRFFRNLRGMTQKYLGQVVGFPEKTADIRMAQYESGSRTPKTDLTNKLAEVFDISPQVLSVPDIDSYTGLMHNAVCVRGFIRLQDRPSGRRNLYPHQQAERLDLCENDWSARTLGGNGSEVPGWGDQP